MKTKQILTLTLTFVIGMVLSLPALAKDEMFGKNTKEITKVLNNALLHNAIIKNVQATNIIEQKCDAILLDIEQNNAQDLKKGLENISVEEFYSERACIETLSALLNKAEAGFNISELLKQFINKFKHPDNLIVSYRRANGYFYNLSLLAIWADLEPLFKSNSQENTSAFYGLADLLITSGADINAKYEFYSRDKESVKDLIYENGSNTAIDLLKRWEEKQTKTKKSEEQKSIHETIVNTINKTNDINERCYEISDDILNLDKKSLTANLEQISIEDFYSERNCIDNIHLLLEMAIKGNNMEGMTKKFINKFGHPDNLIVSAQEPNGTYSIKTLLADWATLGEEQTAQSADYATFLLKKGASPYQEIKMQDNSKRTIKIMVGKNSL